MAKSHIWAAKLQQKNRANIILNIPKPGPFGGLWLSEKNRSVSFTSHHLKPTEPTILLSPFPCILLFVLVVVRGGGCLPCPPLPPIHLLHPTAAPSASHQCVQHGFAGNIFLSCPAQFKCLFTVLVNFSKNVPLVFQMGWTFMVVELREDVKALPYTHF